MTRQGSATTLLALVAPQMLMILFFFLLCSTSTSEAAQQDPTCASSQSGSTTTPVRLAFRSPALGVVGTTRKTSTIWDSTSMHFVSFNPASSSSKPVIPAVFLRVVRDDDDNAATSQQQQSQEQQQLLASDTRELHQAYDDSVALAYWIGAEFNIEVQTWMSEITNASSSSSSSSSSSASDSGGTGEDTGSTGANKTESRMVYQSSAFVPFTSGGEAHAYNLELPQTEGIYQFVFTNISSRREVGGGVVAQAMTNKELWSGRINVSQTVLAYASIDFARAYTADSFFDDEEELFSGRRICATFDTPLRPLHLVVRNSQFQFSTHESFSRRNYVEAKSLDLDTGKEFSDVLGGNVASIENGFATFSSLRYVKSVPRRTLLRFYLRTESIDSSQQQQQQQEQQQQQQHSQHSVSVFLVVYAFSSVQPACSLSIVPRGENSGYWTSSGALMSFQLGTRLVPFQVRLRDSRHADDQGSTNTMLRAQLVQCTGTGAGDGAARGIALVGSTHAVVVGGIAWFKDLTVIQQEDMQQQQQPITPLQEYAACVLKITVSFSPSGIRTNYTIPFLAPVPLRVASASYISAHSMASAGLQLLPLGPNYEVARALPFLLHDTSVAREDASQQQHRDYGTKNNNPVVQSGATLGFSFYVALTDPSIENGIPKFTSASDVDSVSVRCVIISSDPAAQKTSDGTTDSCVVSPSAPVPFADGIATFSKVMITVSPEYFAAAAAADSGTTNAVKARLVFAVASANMPQLNNVVLLRTAAISVTASNDRAVSLRFSPVGSFFVPGFGSYNNDGGGNNSSGNGDLAHFIRPGIFLPPVIVDVINSDGTIDRASSELNITAVASSGATIYGHVSFCRRGQAVFDRLVVASAGATNTAQLRIRFVAGSEGNLPVQGKFVETGVITLLGYSSGASGDDTSHGGGGSDGSAGSSPSTSTSTTSASSVAANLLSAPVGFMFDFTSFLNEGWVTHRVENQSLIPPVVLNLVDARHQITTTIDNSANYEVEASVSPESAGFLDTVRSTTRVRVVRGVATFDNLHVAETPNIIINHVEISFCAVPAYVPIPCITRRLQLSGAYTVYVRPPSAASLAEGNSDILYVAGNPVLGMRPGSLFNVTVQAQDSMGKLAPSAVKAAGNISIDANALIEVAADSAIVRLEGQIQEELARNSLADVSAQQRQLNELLVAANKQPLSPNLKLPKPSVFSATVSFEGLGFTLPRSVMLRDALVLLTFSAPSSASSSSSTVNAEGDNVIVGWSPLLRLQPFAPIPSLFPISVALLFIPFPSFTLWRWKRAMANYFQIDEARFEISRVVEGKEDTLGWKGTRVEFTFLQPSAKDGDVAVDMHRLREQFLTLKTGTCETRHLGIFQARRYTDNSICDSNLFRDSTDSARHCEAFRGRNGRCDCFLPMMQRMGAACADDLLILPVCRHLAQCSDSVIKGTCAEVRSPWIIQALRVVGITIAVIVGLGLLYLIWFGKKYRSKKRPSLRTAKRSVLANKEPHGQVFLA